MKRRSAIQSMLGLPALAAQTAAAAPVAALQTLAPDGAGEGHARLFSPDQLAALEHLCGLVVPAREGRPSAVDAGVPLFLDFLLSQSGAVRRDLYVAGLNQLNSRAGKPFAMTSGAEAASLLAPLKTPWRAEGPKDAFAQFLHVARQDILQATLNSREWAEAGTSRRAAGLNYFWRTMD